MDGLNDYKANINLSKLKLAEIGLELSLAIFLAINSSQIRLDIEHQHQHALVCESQILRGGCLFLAHLTIFGSGFGFKTFFGTYLCRLSSLVLEAPSYLLVFNW